MTKNTLNKKRNNEFVVIKDNKIIQKGINRFTLNENKLITTLLSIYVEDATSRIGNGKVLDSEITIYELIKIYNLKHNLNNYEAIRNTVSELNGKSSIDYYDADLKQYKILNYFSSIIIDENTKKITFKWNEEIKPFLINIEEQYTKYLTSNYLSLKSSRNQNLFELMKSYQAQKHITIKLDDLKVKLNANTDYYNTYSRFNDKVLKPSVKEINDLTDIEVRYKTIKEGKKVISVTFSIADNPKNIHRKYGIFENVWLTEVEYNTIIEEYKAKYLIDEYSRWLTENNTKRNHFQQITSWYYKKGNEEINDEEFDINLGELSQPFSINDIE